MGVKGKKDGEGVGSERLENGPTEATGQPATKSWLRLGRRVYQYLTLALWRKNTGKFHRRILNVKL
jgi:hypothetical protein